MEMMATTPAMAITTIPTAMNTRDVEPLELLADDEMDEGRAAYCSRAIDSNS